MKKINLIIGLCYLAFIAGVASTMPGTMQTPRPTAYTWWDFIYLVAIFVVTWYLGFRGGQESKQ